MTREELEKVFENEETKWEGDNAFQGLVILSKYAKKNDTLIGTGHEVIYSLDIDEALKNGLTKEDADKLRLLNWMLDSECDCFACFV